MSQDEILQAMRRLGGKDLYAKQIAKEFNKIHFHPDIYATLNVDQYTSFTYSLKRCCLAGTVTRRLTNTNRSNNYSGTKQFVYSLT